ncbi:response regulator transcription factor [Fundicoccus sp. Sow4_D5]|uniref:response regulator transcription factor n=1 Tax=Fundicoccus sp. Sow4_D5 TaxID=3438782 RepID=UPI003F8F629F
MFTVFIVEDEQLIREGMLKLVEWHQLGFEVIGQAADGELAWPMIQDLQPDIVITDIRMPFMDGLSLSRIIKQHYPNTKIIILSGYDEFEYAQKAINIGVEHYVLKPITKAQLTELLVKIREEKLKMVEREASLALLQQEAFNQKRRVFFEELMTGSKEVFSLLEQANHLQLDVLKDHYKLVLIMIQPKDPGVLAGFSWTIIERIRQEMIEALTLIPNLFEYKSSSELTVFLLAANEEIQARSFEAEFKILSFFEQEYDDLVFLIATTNSFDRLSEVSEYYNIGRNRLLEQWWRIKSQQISYSYNPPRINSVLKIEKPSKDVGLAQAVLVDETKVSGQGDTRAGGEPDLDYLSFENIPLEWTDSKVLSEFLLEGRLEEIPAFIERILKDVSETQWQSRAFVQYMFLSTYMALQVFIQALDHTLDDALEQSIKLPLAFEHEPSKELLVTYLKEALKDALVARHQHRKSRYYDVIQEASAYIYQHYGEVDLRLSDIANSVNISPAHFTTIFSQETGKTVTEFMTEVRMGQARILLRTTNQTHYEIALAVGYRDVSYFSRLFKRYHNVSPGNYRKGVI